MGERLGFFGRDQVLGGVVVQKLFVDREILEEGPQRGGLALAGGGHVAALVRGVIEKGEDLVGGDGADEFQVHV